MFDHVPCQVPDTTPTLISFVGEAPSDEECAIGRPFVGPAGRTFNTILRSAGLRREEFHITNVFDQQAEDNEVGPWMADPVRCAESDARLAEEFAAYRPSVIVPLGNTALWALTRQTRISAFRGAVMPASRIVPGAKLLPTFHPMAVEHQWKFMPLVTMDFQKAMREAKLGPKIIYPNVKLIVEPTLKEVKAFMARCMDADLLSIDIETGWGQITCIGFGLSATEAMCVPIVDLRQPSKCYWGSPEVELEVWLAMREVLEGPVPKLGQNFLYDIFWLYDKYGIAVRNYREDTRLLHHAVYPDLDKDLGTMAANHTRIGQWKSWGGRFAGDKNDG